MVDGKIRVLGIRNPNSSFIRKSPHTLTLTHLVVDPLLSYAQIRVSVLLSLGYRFSIAGLGSLGVTLEVGRFGLLLPSRVSFICCWGFVPWFLSLLCGTNLDEPVLWSAYRFTLCCSLWSPEHARAWA